MELEDDLVATLEELELDDFVTTEDDTDDDEFDELDDRVAADDDVLGELDDFVSNDELEELDSNSAWVDSTTLRTPVRSTPTPMM